MQGMNIRNTFTKYKNKGFEVKETGAKLIITLALFLLPNMAFAATLDQINQQINNTQNQLNQQKSQSTTLAQTVSNFDNQIGALQGQINATYAEIAKTNKEIKDTTAQIADAEAKLAIARQQLGDIIQTSYENSQQSSIEVIAKSNNFSDYVNRSTYLESIQVKITETAKQIVALRDSLNQKKAQLEADKKKTQALLASQSLQQSAISSQRSAQSYFLAQSKGAEKSLSKTLISLYDQKAALSIQYGETVSGGSSGYPYGNPPPSSRIDTPDAYGYLIGECTSFSAWWRSAHGNPVPRNLGNANTWGTRAASQGYNVNTLPSPGSVMVFPYIGGYGHVAIVNSVNGNGTVNISEYNWRPYQYTQRTVNPASYSAVFIH